MLAQILYIPLAIALAVLLFYSARGAFRGYGKGRLVPFAFLVAVSLFASLYLMLATDWHWVAVGVAAVVVVPVLTPVSLIMVAMVVSWLTGKPMRWN